MFQCFGCIYIYIKEKTKWKEKKKSTTFDIKVRVLQYCLSHIIYFYTRTARPNDSCCRERIFNVTYTLRYSRVELGKPKNIDTPHFRPYQDVLKCRASNCPRFRRHAPNIVTDRPKYARYGSEFFVDEKRRREWARTFSTINPAHHRANNRLRRYKRRSFPSKSLELIFRVFRFSRHGTPISLLAHLFQQ